MKIIKLIFYLTLSNYSNKLIKFKYCWIAKFDKNINFGKIAILNQKLQSSLYQCYFKYCYDILSFSIKSFSKTKAYVLWFEKFSQRITSFTYFMKWLGDIYLDRNCDKIFLYSAHPIAGGNTECVCNQIYIVEN